MQALTFHGPGDVRAERVDDPVLASPRDAIVRVRATAVCGSDLHPYRGLERGLDPGTVLGHELAGEVVEVGREVVRFRPGDRVACPFSTSCGACRLCLGGLPSRCRSGELLGWREGGQGLHGAQAEYVRVPLADATLVAAPEGLDDELILLAGDVLGTGFFAAELAAVSPGSTVAVIGTGAVGLSALLACGERGAGRVFAIDPVRERSALAVRFGASEALAPAEAVERVRAATDGLGADAAIDAVGSAAASRLAIDLVRPGGIIAAPGVHTEERFAFAPGEVYDKNLTYRAGRSPARVHLERLLPLLAAGRLARSREVISHRLPLAAGPRAYDIFDRKLEACTKVLLVPGR